MAVIVLTISNVAQLARVSESTVRREVKSGRLMCARLGSGRRSAIAVSVADYRDWAAGFAATESGREEVSRMRAVLAEVGELRLTGTEGGDA